MSYTVTRSGRRIYVNRSDRRARMLMVARGNLAPRSLKLWQFALDCHNWQRVVDVGVNYGEMLVGARLPAGAQLIGFEPNPLVQPFLCRTLAENRIRLDLRRAAVADRSGTALFAVDTDWSGTSTLAVPESPDPRRWQVQYVPVTTLDETLGGDGKSFCAKVDVEGMEREVVAGACTALATSQYWLLMLEVLHMPYGYLAELAQSYSVYLQELAGSRLVKVPAETGKVEQLLASGEVYGQDCLVADAAVASRLESQAMMSP